MFVTYSNIFKQGARIYFVKNKLEFKSIDSATAEFLKTNPGEINRLLSPNENLVLMVLEKATSALTTRDVRRCIAENALLKRRDSWATDGFNRAYLRIAEKKNVRQLDAKSTREYLLSYINEKDVIWGHEKAAEFLSTVQSELIFHLAEALQIKIIYEATVKSALENLVERGFVIKTLYPVGSSERVSYSINPKIESLKRAKG